MAQYNLEQSSPFDPALACMKVEVDAEGSIGAKPKTEN
jgi:hypothetical protein